ncbi:MAG: class I SAM-dependent methyltransferase [Filifactoraceae bacterium]
MSEVVKKHYNENAIKEWDRLNNPYSNIEFQTTLHMIEQYFNKNGDILDIGSGPGKYSLELLKKGNRVTLYDLSIEELKLAKENIERENLQATDYICGDCSDLDQFEDNSFDLVLVMGPMYHIHSKTRRLEILRQVKRILKKGGIALVAYLNGVGVVKSTINECSIAFSSLDGVKELLKDRKWDKEESFTETYTVTPKGAIEEIRNLEFDIITYFGAESFASGIHYDVTKMAVEEPECYKNLIELCKQTCEREEYRDSTEHIHFIIR